MESTNGQLIESKGPYAEKRFIPDAVDTQGKPWITHYWELARDALGSLKWVRLNRNITPKSTNKDSSGK